MIPYVVGLLCVAGLAAGQILFKMSATALHDGGSFLSMRVAATLLAAMCLYGVTSIGWVWALQKVELGKIYPLMALAFVLVPFGSHLFFGEQFPPTYFVGIAMIMAGIVVAIRV